MNQFLFRGLFMWGKCPRIVIFLPSTKDKGSRPVTWIPTRICEVHAMFENGPGRKGETFSTRQRVMYYFGTFTKHIAFFGVHREPWVKQALFLSTAHSFPSRSLL